MEYFMTVVTSLADLDGTNGVRFNGNQSVARGGTSISAKGDFDNDGLFDLAFGGVGVGNGTFLFGSTFGNVGEIIPDNRPILSVFDA
jgi:hypothetical protein